MKNKYIIFRTDRIGEVLLSTIIINGIKKDLSDAEITFVTSEYSMGLFSGRSDIDEVITFDSFTKKGIWGRTLRLAWKIRQKGVGTAIVINPNKYLHLACFLAGIPIRAGYDRKWGFLLNRKIEDKRDSGEKHEVDYALDLLPLIGVSNEGLKLDLPVSSEFEEKVNSFLVSKNITDNDLPLIVMHPGSSNPAKMWPENNYIDLIKRIDLEIGCNIVLMGSEKEKELSGVIIKGTATGAVNSAGEFDLEGLAALIKRADLFVGNDTGPMHMAAALGVPVIAIFGRNIKGVSPRRWGPWGEGHTVFHRADDCADCDDKDCPFEYRCLKDISVDEVFEAVKKKLKM